MAPTEARTTRFLADAASLLASTSPAVSAQLNATRRDFEQQNPEDKAMSCNACGTSFILGWNCKTVASPANKRTRQDRLAGKAQHKRLSIQCSTCNSVTQIESAKPEKSRARVEKSKLQAKASRDPSGPQEEAKPAISATVPAATEAGVKKRSRSKKSSLQALLADRKPTEAKKGLGLDLMDFMKT